eukprot:1868231-Prymnesium_polylepis.1
MLPPPTSLSNTLLLLCCQHSDIALQLQADRVAAGHGGFSDRFQRRFRGGGHGAAGVNVLVMHSTASIDSVISSASPSPSSPSAPSGFPFGPVVWARHEQH